MKTLKTFFAKKANRLYIYSILIAASAVALFYGLIDKDAIPLWLFLAANVLGITGGATAIGKLSPDAPPIVEPGDVGP